VGKWVDGMMALRKAPDISKRTRETGTGIVPYSARVKQVGRSLDTVGVKLLSIVNQRSIMILQDGHPRGRLTTPTQAGEDVFCHEIEQVNLKATCKRDDVVVIVFQKAEGGGVGHYVPTRAAAV
jgi:hypothetical protein